MKSLLTVVISSSLLLSGCTTYRDMKSYQPEESVLIQSSYTATQHLLKNVNSAFYYSQPLIVTTLVDVNSLTETSTFGRMVSEQVRTKLATLGFQTIEFKIEKNIFAKKLTGEVALSNDLRYLAKINRSQAIIVGTYAKSLHHVYVNLKMVNPITNSILGSYDYVLSLDPNIKHLITQPES